jgi:hypothetical protein
MKLEPIACYRQASYPTRDAVDADPEVLRRVPARWQGQAIVLTALAATTGLLALRTQVARAEGQPDAPAAAVAPIFDHGIGRCQFAGPARLGPDVISENEARKIIQEGLAQAGLDMKPDALTIPVTAIPVTRAKGHVTETKPGPLTLDLVDDGKHVAVEYVSKNDYQQWGGKETRTLEFATVEMKAAAQLLRDGLPATAPAGAYGVFYDPTGLEADGDDRQMRELLRLQVKDFVAWLKVQGVI